MNATAESLDELALELIAREQTSKTLSPDAGVAVAAVRDCSTIFSRTYGLRARDHHLPVTPRTSFEICSLTKAFTAVALLKASEAGRIDLESPINSPELLLLLEDAELTRRISFVDILAHRTGLPSLDLLWYFGLSREEVLQAASQLVTVPRGFRKTFIYNNLMYGALGVLFDRLVGTSWESYVRDNILIPLKMTSTSFEFTDAGPDVALPYVGTKRVPRVDLTAIAAAGAMQSNLEDMTSWLSFLLSGKTPSGVQLLTESSLRFMRRDHVTVTDPNPLFFQGLEWLIADSKPRYGLAWFLGTTRGLEVLFHPGYIDGFSTVLVVVPELRLGFVVLANLNLSGFPGRLVQVLLDALLQSHQTDDRDDDQDATTAVAAEAVVGRYENSLCGCIAVARKGSGLVIEYKGRSWSLAWDGDKVAQFSMTAFGLEIQSSIRFEGREGRATRLTIPLSLDPTDPPQTFVRCES